MSVCILMNNKNKFKVEGTLEDWVQKIKTEQVFEISPTIYVVSNNISEVYLDEKPQNDIKEKKSKKKK
ncbi:hypothetical protein [Clostridium lacusfryxellense]|uniref:hypothetical protein n=1 Tax=Clostridium lacusfryxellense TaxID=205328 RepID=UPI001C0B5981|nr:hypothetical protein [Clostridium lacusfryxellense]MBU3112547.1 hypothetical protein [Clostridium lacusfryxellense]